MAWYWWTTTLKELWLGSWDSILDRANQRQDYKNQVTQNSNTWFVSQMESDSDMFLEKSLNSSDATSSKMNSAACNINDLAVSMDKWRFQNRWVHIDKTKYPTANAILQKWMSVFPNDKTHINNCIDGKADLPTTLQRLGIVLTDEDRQMLEEKNQMSFSNRNISYDPNLSLRSTLTPQDSEANDNLIPHLEPTSFADADNKLVWFAWNAVKSLWNLWADLVDMFVNFKDTATTLAELPVGIVNNITWLDDELDSMTGNKLYNIYNEANQIADWMWDYLIERYWWTDENWNLNWILWWLATLGDTIYKDPAWVLSDVAWLLSGWAWATKTLLKKTKYANAANTAAKIQKYANAVDPINIIENPVNAFKETKWLVKKGVDAVKSTDLWKTVSKVYDKIWDYVVQSDKIKWLRSLVDTKVWKLLFPDAKDLYKQIAPMSTSDIAKFEVDFWEKYWDYLNRMWVDWKPAEIVDKLQYQTDKLYKESTDAFKKMSENWDKIKITNAKEAWDIKNMLAWNIQTQGYLDPHNTAALKKMAEIYQTFLTTWEIDPMDFLTQKRYFERKSKFTYANPNNYNALKWQRATNIDSTAREVMLNFADTHWYENLRQVNEQIRKNRSIIDWMWKSIVKGYAPWTIWLSDIIYAAASWNPNALTRLAAKWIVNNSFVNNLRLGIGNKIRWVSRQPRETVDMDEIRKVNAQNRVQDAYDFAVWDWSPRLTELYGWWVEATDNMDRAVMRDADAIADAERIIETYAHTPWDVEKKVVEWQPTSKITSKWWRTVVQSNIFDSLLE